MKNTPRTLFDRVWIGINDGEVTWCQDNVYEAEDCTEYVPRAKLDTIEHELQQERVRSRQFAGLVQTNTDWRCPYGENVPSMGLCSLGFPGCACADDRLAVLCEDEERIVAKLTEERDQLQKGLADARRALAYLYAAARGQDLRLSVAEELPMEEFLLAAQDVRLAKDELAIARAGLYATRETLTRLLQNIADKASS